MGVLVQNEAHCFRKIMNTKNNVLTWNHRKAERFSGGLLKSLVRIHTLYYNAILYARCITTAVFWHFLIKN